jgi:hypothetical protein
MDAMSRFMSKVVIVPGACWIWVAGVNQCGYGWFRANGKAVRAHKFIYERLRGPVPDGLVLDHRCRIRRCVNPEHLKPITRVENTLIGFAPTAQNARKTHCKRGHELAGENLGRRSDRPSERVCRACEAIRRVGEVQYERAEASA